MLVLSRRVGEEIVIGDHVRVHILSLGKRRVVLGFTAPQSVHIRRGEIQDTQLEFVSTDRTAITPSAAAF